MWKNEIYLNEASGADEGNASAGFAVDGGQPLNIDEAPAPQGGAYDWIPEKFRVMNDAGEIDIETSAKKIAQSYTHLERFKGGANVPPATPDDYQLTVPDELKEAWNPAEDQVHQAFRQRAHEAGMSQQQFDAAMQTFFQDIVPQIAGAGQDGGSENAQANCESELRKVWTSPQEFSRNVQAAYSGAAAIAQKAGMSINDIMESPLANDPTFIKLLAAIGPEFSEDSAPATTSMAAPTDIKSLMASPAYTDPKHPDHQKVSEQVSGYYKTRYGANKI